MIKIMPHIHTSPGHHDLTASAFIIRLDKSEPTVMLHMHKKLNQYLQFGGHVELDETPWQTIIHEIKEETGYDIEQLQLLQPPNMLTHLSKANMHPNPLALITYKYGEIDHFHTDTSFAFVANEEPRHQRAINESSDIKLFTKSELMDAPKYKIPEDVSEICLYIMNTYPEQWKLVDTTLFSR